MRLSLASSGISREPRAFPTYSYVFREAIALSIGVFHSTARIEYIYTRYKAGNIVSRCDERGRKIHARACRMHYYSRDATRPIKNPLAPTKLTILMEY